MKSMRGSRSSGRGFWENGRLYGKGGGSVRVRHDRGTFWDNWRLAVPTEAQPAAAPLGYPQEVLPEPNTDEDIEERVEAGVGVRQALGNLFDHIKAADGLAVGQRGVGCLRGLEYQQSV